MSDDLVILNGDDVIIVHDAEPPEIEVQDLNVVVYEGPGGVDASMSLTAGETLAVGQVVFPDAGKLYAFVPDGIEDWGKAVGICITPAVANGVVRVADHGLLKKPSWGLTPGQVYYAIAAGAIGQLDGTEITILPVGIAIAEDIFKIDLGTSFTKRV